MAETIEGVTATESYSCNMCNASYSSAQEAKDCFDKGLPSTLEVGTTYFWDSGSPTGSEGQISPNSKHFVILFLGSDANFRNHEKRYVVESFPESEGYQFIDATANFEGSSLENINGIDSRGGLVNLTRGEKATRLSESGLRELLESNEGFRTFHEKYVSEFSR